MPTKSAREYGSGSIFQRADGAWIGRLEIGWTSEGRRRRIQVSARTETECRRRLVKKRREIEAEGIPVEGLDSRVTVKAWAEKWIELRHSDLGAKTHGNYAGALRKWIIPAIGRKQLSSLTPGDVRAVTDLELTSGNAAASTRQTRRVLVKMLRDAMVEGYAVPPRLFEIKGLEVADSDREDIPLVDASLLLAAALELPHASRWIVGFFEGMRQGEILGLTWDHVDLERGLITVEYQLASLPYRDRVAGTFRHPAKITPIHLWRSYHLIPPKTKRGRRVIPIIGPVHAALTAWKTVAPASPYGLVWPRETGEPTNPQADSAEWVRLQDAAQVAHVKGTQGRRYDGHEIRHTTATILLEIGADPKTIETILGHSSIVTSRGYQHVSQKLARDAMEKVAEHFAFTYPASSAPAAIER